MKRVRDAGREAVLLALFGILAVAGVVFLVFGADDSGGPVGPVGPESVTGNIVRRDHILSRGGYNAWTGAWLMRNGAVRTAWVNLDGPGAPPCRRANEPARCDDQGFRGVRHRFEMVESRDQGRTWSRPLPDETVLAAMPYAYTGQPTIALRARDDIPDGTLLRRVNGEDISGYREFAGIPGTAFLQRRKPGETRWSGQQIPLDPARYTYNFSRIQRLRDGRTLVALGAFWEVGAGKRLSTPAQETPAWLLMKSTDEGTTWHNALEIPAAAQIAAPANEWDIAELYDGDLLAVMRTREGKRPARKQVILEKTDDKISTNTGTSSDGGWRMGPPALTPAGFAQVAGPQHPELLNIEYGPARGGILHIADEAIHYTADGGASWSEVPFPSGWSPHYYPNSVQAPGGNIHIFSHAGTDDPYTTEVDKPVYSDIIRLAPDRSGLIP